MNLSSSIISPLIGSFVNDHFLGVTRKSMLKEGDHGYLTMSAVSLALSVFQFIFIFTIPTKDQIEREMNEVNSKADGAEDKPDEAASESAKNESTSVSDNLLVE